MSWRKNRLAHRDNDGRRGQGFIDFLDKLDPNTVQRIADEVADRIRQGGRVTADVLRRWQRRGRRRP